MINSKSRGLAYLDILLERHGQGLDIIYMADEARRLIDCLGQDGGYIFGPGHTYIQVDAPLANIMAMYETAAGYRPWS